MSVRTSRRRVVRVSLPDDAEAAAAGLASRRHPQATTSADLLAAEEPLGIRVDGQAIALTMRTPGDDVDLAAGFLVSEGIVRYAADIDQIKVCTAGGCGHRDHDDAGNIADVTLGPAASLPPALRRNFMTTSACGVCGKASIRELAVSSPYDVRSDATRVQADVLAGLPPRLRAAQRVFSATGGLHAAGLFSADGRQLCIREDVGRHNAVDKVVGWALREQRLPLSGCALVVSGRTSFELVQKAALAGIPVLAAVSAPSSLAVELAEDAGLTLVGFLRGNSMNVYTGEYRIALDQASAESLPRHRAGLPAG